MRTPARSIAPRRREPHDGTMAEYFSPNLLTSLVLMATTAIALSGCSVNVDVGESERRVEVESVPADGIAALSLVTDDGTLEIRGDDVDDISIETIYDEPDRATARAACASIATGSRSRAACDASWYEQCSVSYRIVMPDRRWRWRSRPPTGGSSSAISAADIDVSTDNGAIEAVRLLAGDVHAETDNGRVELSFDEVPDAVEARSDNGRIDITVPVASRCTRSTPSPTTVRSRSGRRDGRAGRRQSGRRATTSVSSATRSPSSVLTRRSITSARSITTTSPMAATTCDGVVSTSGCWGPP